ncbi:hypothetical protein [Ferrimonas aestuarii]|uniref:Immunity protein 17 n=1 Tax=Ferrimonas aestuarii TaxID=2569539 RepID=A0A4U1BVV3_9GAMM|nr:hypothetical protein [Ferrimonas aestuarii]TKB57329.1 hypothetical protein FCL42_03365 [Ferrimonas aestuarii]
MFTLIENAILGAGVILVIISLIQYSRRQGNYHGFWRVWLGQLKDFTPAEFKLYRAGIVLLFVGVILRIINLV